MPVAILALAFFALAVISGRIILIPLLCSLALSYLLAPVVSWFERRGWSRPSSVLLTLTAMTLGLILALIFLLPSLWTQMTRSYDQASQLVGRLPQLEQSLTSVKRVSPPLYQFIQSQVKRLNTPEEQTRLRDLAAGWLQSGWFKLVDLTTSILDLLLIPFFVYYLLADYREMRNRLDRLIPPRYHAVTSELLSQVNRVLSSYVRNQLLIALCMGSLYTIGFSILQVPLALTLGLLSGLLNFIPYLGTLTGLGLSLSFVALEGGGLGRLMGLAGVFIVVQSFEGYYLTPKLLSSRLQLHPLWVLAGLMIGGNLFGLLGIILAVPVIAVAKVVLGFLEDLYQQSNFYRDAGMTLLTDRGQPVVFMAAPELPPQLIDESAAQTPRRTVITTTELKSRVRESRMPPEE
ncbi:MAG TPA: AI-2E family transporter [Blastocatellia bacterium]|nr:AI-2E family transporter [Blastocatellia bacterium]